MSRKWLSFVIIICIFLLCVAGTSANIEITILKAQTPPAIDGVFYEDEWGKKLFTIESGEENNHTFTEEYAKDFTAEIYALWDENYLYVAAVAVYPEHKNERPAEAMWMNDCMQICIAPNWEQANVLRNELGFSLGSDLTTHQSYAWFSIFSTSPIEYDSADFKITRENDTTVYEVAIPWDSVSEQETYSQGDTIAFSAAFTMGRAEQFAGIEYSQGIITTKDASNSAKTTLGSYSYPETESQYTITTEDGSSQKETSTESEMEEETAESEIEDEESGNILIYIAIPTIAIIIISVKFLVKKKINVALL